MPFASEKQRRWMHAHRPEMASRWEAEEARRRRKGLPVIEKSLVEISKADRESDKEYRRSFLYALNPRSETKVRRGTTGNRALRAGGGAVAGSVAGGVIGAAAGASGGAKGAEVGARVGSALGTAAGGTYGRQRNLDSGDVVARHRKTGKKAKGIASTGGAPALNIGWYDYPKGKKKKGGGE